MGPSRHRVRCAFVLAVTVLGCDARPVTGGTPGVLMRANESLGDIQITVHRLADGSAEAIGFGVTGTDGTFALFTNGAKGPLQLPPGEYRFTLESIGSPLRIPTICTQPETTPLHVKWSADDRKLELELP